METDKVKQVGAPGTALEAELWVSALEAERIPARYVTHAVDVGYFGPAGGQGSTYPVMVSGADIKPAKRVIELLEQDVAPRSHDRRRNQLLRSTQPDAKVAAAPLRREQSRLEIATIAGIATLATGACVGFLWFIAQALEG